ncbi:MAG: S9 family peptidase [Comamonadaceae bacterium]|nr:MAG: S9 family peptidase [Comamonadaceae bacterium]
MQRAMTQAFTVSDLYLHRHVTDIDLVDGCNVAACTVKSVDAENDGYESSIWTLELDGSRVRQLTQGGAQDQSPRWSPDGQRLAFLSTRSGSTQVFVIERDGGEARQLGDFAQGVSNLAWAPDGASLVVAAAVVVDPDLRGERASGRDPSRKKKCKPEIAWRLPYKEDGIGYLLQREFHLFRLCAQSGQATQLTDGPFDVLAFDIARHTGQIAYARTRAGRFAHRNDLWVCNADGTQARQLTRDHAIVMQPRWSPDASRIAFTGAVEEGDAEPVLWLLDLADSRTRALCADTLDVADPTSVSWDANGEAIVLARAWRGRHQVARVRVADESLSVLRGGNSQIGAFCANAEHIVYTVEDPSRPGEVHALRRTDDAAAAAQGERRLSDFNAWWHGRHAVQAEPIAFEVPDGMGATEVIEGWLIRASDSQGVQPMLCDVHGGPASYALLDYGTNVFWHALCARGWSVLALNAVGSASYGREFCRRLAGHWGEYDLPQYVAAIEQARERGLCDDRVAIVGKSYGGFLTALASGQADRFKAAVVMAPVGNIETHYGTSDGGYYADPFYLGSQPRFDRALARRLSPLQHIEKSTTPTLFMQGKDDERCPKCQSEEMFVSLARSGDTPTELVLYPGETHAFLASGAPSCREDAALRIMDWVERHALHRYLDPARPEPTERRDFSLV